MKAYDITKLTAKVKSRNVQYINKIYYFVACFGQLTYVLFTVLLHTVKPIPYSDLLGVDN